MLQCFSKFCTSVSIWVQQMLKRRPPSLWSEGRLTCPAMCKFPKPDLYPRSMAVAEANGSHIPSAEFITLHWWSALLIKAWKGTQISNNSSSLVGSLQSDSKVCAISTTFAKSYIFLVWLMQNFAFSCNLSLLSKERKFLLPEKF